MPVKTAPTKSNLIALKKSLALAKLGYDLLDKKRNIIMREMMKLIDDVDALQGKIDSAFAEAYEALQNANMTLGQNEVLKTAMSKDTDDDLTVRYRSVMGIEIPEVVFIEKDSSLPSYSLALTNVKLDEAYIKFKTVKRLSAEVAVMQNSVIRLATAVKQSQKRANALKNIVIPRYEEQIHFISGYLEEKEREEFSALKVIKNRSNG